MLHYKARLRMTNQRIIYNKSINGISAPQLTSFALQPRFVAHKTERPLFICHEQRQGRENNNTSTVIR